MSTISPTATGCSGGLKLKQSLKPPIEIRNNKSVEFFWNFRNVKPSYWRLSGDGSVCNTMLSHRMYSVR